MSSPPLVSVLKLSPLVYYRGRCNCSGSSTYAPTELDQSGARLWLRQQKLFCAPRRRKERCEVRRTRWPSDWAGLLLPIHFHRKFVFSNSRTECEMQKWRLSLARLKHHLGSFLAKRRRGISPTFLDILHQSQ